MAQNTSPIFTLTPNWGSPGKVTTANTAKDGTGTVITIFTAGTNGSRIEEISIAPLGTNIATVLRLFINNGSSNATPANNSLIREVTCPGATVSEVAALTLQQILFADGLVLPAGYKLNITVGTTIAAGLQVSVINGGDY